MRTSAWTARSAGERRVTTPWGASAASAPPASTTSRGVEAARTSTSAPPARTPASLAALTQMGATSADAHLDTSVQDKGAWLSEWLCGKLSVGVSSWLTVCCCFRHCVTGLGFSGGSSAGQGGEVDDNSLSPEACYECKINGYPKKGRKRRSTNSTQEDTVEDMQVICLSECSVQGRSDHWGHRGHILRNV